MFSKQTVVSTARSSRDRGSDSRGATQVEFMKFNDGTSAIITGRNREMFSPRANYPEKSFFFQTPTITDFSLVISNWGREH